MKSIWKFPLQVKDNQTITVPSYCKPLTVQLQGDVPTLWALVDDESTRTICYAVRCYGTGHPCDEERGEYVGTIQQANGLVWHYFI